MQLVFLINYIELGSAPGTGERYRNIIGDQNAGKKICVLLAHFATQIYLSSKRNDQLNLIVSTVNRS